MIAASINELLARIALNEDAAAYKSLFLYYHPRLLSFSLAITQSRESSEEVVSDVFLKIWDKRKTLLQISNFHLYLFVSVKNLSLNYLAKQKRSRVFSLDQVDVDYPSQYANPEQMMISAEMQRSVYNAVQMLPPKCRLIFKLVKEENLRYKEVAELLELSVKTVEAQMTIALRKIGEAVYNTHSSLS